MRRLLLTPFGSADFRSLADRLLGMQNYRDIDPASPFSAALASVGLPSLGIIVAAGAIFGLVTSAFTNMLAVTRVWCSMSGDGLLPRWFARTHPTRRVPHRITWIVGVVSAVIAGLLPIKDAADLTNIGILTAFVIVAIAVVVLRYRRPDLPRGFRTPWVPVVPAIGVVFSVWLISQLDLWSVKCRRAVSSSGSSDTEAERVAGAVRQVDHGVLGAGVLQ